MSTILILGFLLGMKHALEADHVAAVASLATRASSLRDTVRVATSWGVGHAVIMVLVGVAVIGLEASMPDRLASAFERLVGVMLFVLGVDVLRRLHARRVHVHVHEHGDGIRHVHVHAHDAPVPHERPAHEHDHVTGLLPRAFVVGGVHGLAGSAALVLLSLQTIHSRATAVVYVALFGFGSIVGMALFSVVIALPLRSAVHLSQRAASGCEAILGVANVVLGVWMATRAL